MEYYFRHWDDWARDDHSMRTYRIYFLASDRRIIGREDFQAVGDDNARVIAEVLYGACSDACLGFSLWDGTRQLDATAPVPFESVDKITRRAQEHVLEVEIRLHDSNWAIASSARLLAQTSLLRARLTSEPDTKHAQAPQSDAPDLKSPAMGEPKGAA